MLYCIVSSTEAKIVTRKILEADPKALINVIKTETFKGKISSDEALLNVRSIVLEIKMGYQLYDSPFLWILNSI